MKVAIASGKGGTGKTTLSVNLASFLAETKKVVLADLDAEEPNIQLFLPGDLINSQEVCVKVPEWIPQNCKLCGKCQDVCHFNSILKLGYEILIYPELCHSCYACVGLCPSKALKMVDQNIGELNHFQIGKLFFVESRLNIGRENTVPLIKETHHYIEKYFNHKTLKIYDSPPGTSCPVIETVKDTDFVLLVTEPTPFGLHDLTIAVETVRMLGKNFGVVINRDGIGDNKVETYCKNENIKIVARIKNDREIAQLYSKGQLIYPRIETFKVELENIVAFLTTIAQQ